MLLGQFIVPFALAAFLYLILALQVSSGFPPLYQKYEGPMEDELMPILPFVFALMAIMLASAIITELFVLFGVVSAWCGLRVRRTIQKRTNGPLPWLLNPLTIGITNRWPMILFDLWTLGMIALMGLLIFVSSQ
jgi:hypothetical protein